MGPRLAPMIIPALLPLVAVVLLGCPGCGRADLAPFHEVGSAERIIPAEKHPASSHGPQIDNTDDFLGDPHRAYPGMNFGPMGPVVRSALPNDATLRSLSSASGDDAEQRLPKESQLASPRSGDDTAVTGDRQSPKPEYHIVSVEFTRVETPFLIGIWILFASIAKIGFHMTPKLNKIFPESCLLIAVGVIVGLLLFQASSVHISPLTPDTFFLYMLPPIILDAGYFMPNRLFFDHLWTILLFAVLGTIFNTMSIGWLSAATT